MMFADATMLVVGYLFPSRDHEMNVGHRVFGAHGGSGNQIALQPHYWSWLDEDRAPPDLRLSHLSPLDLRVFDTAFEHAQDRILMYEAPPQSSPQAFFGCNGIKFDLRLELHLCTTSEFLSASRSTVSYLKSPEFILIDNSAWL
jgi:hypothetical protein